MASQNEPQMATDGAGDDGRSRERSQRRWTAALLGMRDGEPGQGVGARVPGGAPRRGGQRGRVGEEVGEPGKMAEQEPAS